MRFTVLSAAVLTMYLLVYPTSVEAVSDDYELSIMAAEQRKENDANVTLKEDIEVFDNSSNNAASDESIDDDTSSVSNENIENDDDSKINETDTAAQVNTVNADVDDNVKKNEIPQTDVQNPIVTYSNFEDAAKKVGFIPLYIPRKSGFAMNYIAVISGNIVEIRYSKRWEPSVTLSVRTYKRSPEEKLQDISGVNGVKWKVDLSSGMTIYIARVNENTNAAAWSVGQYTFAAMTENLSFAAFHAFIVEELVDLCNHYFINI
ncbi:MAG: hypothetical protein IJ862_07290 [Selenomonadaceae bacterium]|nr:hypothetical protein [Selenomonadaceae bacterium]